MNTFNEQIYEYLNKPASNNKYLSKLALVQIHYKFFIAY